MHLLLSIGFVLPAGHANPHCGIPAQGSGAAVSLFPPLDGGPSEALPYPSSSSCLGHPAAMARGITMATRDVNLLLMGRLLLSMASYRVVEPAAPSRDRRTCCCRCARGMRF